MSEQCKKINSFFKNISKKQLNEIECKIVLSERQEKIFNMFYIKDKDINYISDILCVSTMTVNNELKIIRKKLLNVLEE